MNIALVDDSLSDRQFLYNNIQQYCQTHKVHAQVSIFENGAAFLHSLQKISYDIAFLDIYMGDSNGLQLAERLKDRNPQCQIIFCTTSGEHAVKAFRVNALDYLVKPYTYELLEEAMERCQHVLQRFAHYIELKEGRNYTRILISDIIYTDYYNHYIQVHTGQRTVRSYMPFADFAPMLEPYPQFLCCYRNCMVNMDYIESMDEKDFILKNQERIPISRGRKNEIIQSYADYVFDYVNGGKTL